MLRGVLFHRLMQSLPDVPAARREEVGNLYLARAGAAFSAEERSRFLAQALAVFVDPRFAPLFASGSRAEVPIIGRLALPGRSDIRVSGQMDRLVVTTEAVLIGDYKTNRDPPRDLVAAPRAYVDQLAIYRGVLARIYPDRPIRCILVWTEIPHLMELPPAMLDEALAAIQTSPLTG